MALLDIYPISADTLDMLEPLYAEFRKVAQVEYGWPLDAVEFKDVRKLFTWGPMRGYLIKDVQEDRMLGFMLYQVENFQALEIKVLYLHNDVPVKPVLDELFNRFLDDVKTLPGWDIASFALLGEGQGRYINYTTWYGFKAVGQAVVKFHIFDGISVEIFKKQKYGPLPEGYRFISYDKKYEAGVIDVITESFADSVDALWDPRFRTREGICEALKFVQNGGYGLFWPSGSTILLNTEDTPVGACLLNIVSPEEANIPLIGILKSERRHKFGRQLLAQTVEKCINEVISGKIGIKTISATVATANIPAITMYRHNAFQEDHWYPHIYQERDSVLARKAGQWC